MYQPLLAPPKPTGSSPISYILSLLLLFAIAVCLFDSGAANEKDVQEIASFQYPNSVKESSVGTPPTSPASPSSNGGAPAAAAPSMADPMQQQPAAIPPLPPPPEARNSGGVSPRGVPPSPVAPGTPSVIRPPLEGPGGSLAGSSNASPDTRAARGEQDDFVHMPPLPEAYSGGGGRDGSQHGGAVFRVRDGSPGPSSAMSTSSRGSELPLLPGGRLPLAPSLEDLPSMVQAGIPPSGSGPLPGAGAASSSSGGAGPSGEVWIELGDVAPFELADAERRPRETRVSCGDPTSGYRARVGRCEDVNYHFVHLAWRSKIKVPLVIDAGAFCESGVCQASDKWICCKKRPHCLEYPAMVDGGCQFDTIANPYEYAFCETYPCTPTDARACCIDPSGVLFERLNPMRAYARSAPSALAPKIEPQISFAQHKTAWVDITRQTSVAGEKWAPLVDFMVTWGQGGWGGQTAWIQMTQDGKDAYRDLQLKIHTLTCEHTLDDMAAFFTSPEDTYLVHCPRWCLGRPELQLDQSYYRWKVRPTREAKKKGLPLYLDRDAREPQRWGRFTRSETFVSRAVAETRGGRLWVEVKLENDPDGPWYWLPTIVEDPDRVPPFQVYVDQVVPEVKGCGGVGFAESDWFTSDSPICVAARTLNIMGGDEEMVEVTIGPKQPKYDSCTHGGIETTALSDTSAVQGSFRLGPYGFEMMHQTSQYVDRTVRYLWASRTAAMKAEHMVRVVMKWHLKLTLFLNMLFPISTNLDELRRPLGERGLEGENTVAGVLVLWSFCIIKPMIGLGISITIDTIMDYFFPRARIYLNDKLDLGPPDSVKGIKLEKFKQVAWRQITGQYNPTILGSFVLFEIFFTTMKFLEITDQSFWIICLRIFQLEVFNRQKFVKRDGVYPQHYPKRWDSTMNLWRYNFQRQLPEPGPQQPEMSLGGDKEGNVSPRGSKSIPASPKRAASEGAGSKEGPPTKAMQALTIPGIKSAGSPMPSGSQSAPSSPRSGTAGSPPGPFTQAMVDYSHAFMEKLGERIRELMASVVPPEGQEEGWMLSRFDVLGWVAGFDVQKVIAEDDMEAALERECRPPLCVLKDFKVTKEGRLTVGAEAIPAIATNLGIDWELQQIEVTSNGETQTIVYFALANEDIMQSAKLMKQMCPDTDKEVPCPQMEMEIEEIGAEKPEEDPVKPF